MKKRDLSIPLLVGTAGAIVLALVVLSTTLKPIKLTPPPGPTPTPKVTVTVTSTSTTVTPTSTEIATPAPTSTVTDTPVFTETAFPSPTRTVTTTPISTPTQGSYVSPYPDATLCASHINSLFHTLWDGVRGCHYDHEHGENPFTQAVVGTFPGFDLFSLLGGVEIGSTNPSSPAENVAKHGGMKWQVQTTTPRGCFTGFEDAQYGVDAAVIEYHNFGDYSVEFEARVHSTVALLRQCVPGSADYGYIYTVQFQDYGQRTTPYQGTVIPYPNTPLPAYVAGDGPYFTLDCFGTGLTGCRSSRQFVLDRSANANSIWTSKPTGPGPRPEFSRIFRLLFRVRDNYQLFDSGDLAYPFTFSWLCSNDSGLTYAALPGCRYNNSTSRVHEIAGTIPAAWDNLAGFDTDARVGRITAEGYTTRFGQLNTSCAAPSVVDDCFPIKLVNAYVGNYGTQLIDDKINQFSSQAQPERDIGFCFGVVCVEDSSGYTPSGWIGKNN